MGESVQNQLGKIVPGVSWSEKVVDTPHGCITTIQLPVAPESDYRFNLHLYPDGETGISADRIGGNEGEYFWHKQFELADYGGDQQELEADFLKIVGALLTRETMIVQKTGLIWSTFRLAFRVGQYAYGVNFVAAPRFNFNAPKIRGRKHFYRARPLGEDRSHESAPKISRGGSTILLFGAKERYDGSSLR